MQIYSWSILMEIERAREVIKEVNNGKIVAIGEGYKQKKSAEKGIRCIQKIAKKAKIVYLD